MSVNGRQKGHTYERQLAEKFREYFPDCVTSRMESKAEDDRGGDLCNTGCFRVQAKAVERLSPQIHEVLARMHKDEKLNVVFHKRNRKGTVVSMNEETFWILYRLAFESNYS